MAFTKKYSVDVDVLDSNGNQSTVKGHEVTVGGFDGTAAARRVASAELSGNGRRVIAARPTRKK